MARMRQIPHRTHPLQIESRQPRRQLAVLAEGQVARPRGRQRGGIDVLRPSPQRVETVIEIVEPARALRLAQQPRAEMQVRHKRRAQKTQPPEVAHDTVRPKADRQLPRATSRSSVAAHRVEHQQRRARPAPQLAQRHRVVDFVGADEQVDHVRGTAASTVGGCRSARIAACRRKPPGNPFATPGARCRARCATGSVFSAWRAATATTWTSSRRAACNAAW